MGRRAVIRALNRNSNVPSGPFARNKNQGRGPSGGHAVLYCLRGSNESLWDIAALNRKRPGTPFQTRPAPYAYVFQIHAHDRLSSLLLPLAVLALETRPGLQVHGRVRRGAGTGLPGAVPSGGGLYRGGPGHGTEDRAVSGRAMPFGIHDRPPQPLPGPQRRMAHGLQPEHEHPHFAQAEYRARRIQGHPA